MSMSPRICKCPYFILAELGDGDKLQTSHPRFGPFYCTDESELYGKEQAWKKVWEKSGDESRTCEIYLSAMRRIKKDARDAYGDKALHNLPEFQFLWMMIKDGCFFLQLALLILGVSSKQLGYPDNHMIFGKKQNKEDVKRWIESMFFVGNQIPLVVLNELMKQTFFQNILQHVISCDVPSELSKRILYDLLVLPQITSPVSRKGFEGKDYWLVEQQPSDLLHALHCLMFDSRGDLWRGLTQDETGDDNLESGLNMESRDITLSAMELERRGISLKKLEQVGCRNIVFKDCILFARLYLPTFAVDDDTEVLWKGLKYYEMTQQQGKRKCEVSSYLQFMNDLICTYDDVSLLAEKGIVKADRPYHKEKLPIMLSKLAGKDKSTTEKLSLLRIRLKNYRITAWDRFKMVAVLVSILALFQTVFALLAYFKPPPQK